jgi:hypothetical protein
MLIPNSSRVLDIGETSKSAPKRPFALSGSIISRIVKVRPVPWAVIRAFAEDVHRLRLPVFILIDSQEV